jgi:type I restriction enzyme S subunit
MSKLDFSYPSLAEQTRIAKILSDMDTELEVLENTLGKARQIKQGMMQELLTGRVRLV